MLEGLLAVLVAALGVVALGLRTPRAGALLLAMVVAGGAAAALARARPEPPPSPIAISTGGGFTSSSACKSCHPAEYSSWHASYHRRMTQPATLENVAAEALRRGARLRTDAGGRSVELSALDGRLWASLPDPSSTSAVPAGSYESVFRSAPQRSVPVRLLTGSHHHQAFWVEGARGGELRALPAVFLIAEQRLIPRRDAFLNPPDAPEQAVRWNSNCVQCHAVGGAPAHDEVEDVFRSSAVELGIACEACHGAGEEHVQRMQNPLTRYRARAAKSGEPSVVNPLALDPVRGSQVCGRCHSYFFPKDEAKWWRDGFTSSYRPGGDLTQAQLLLSPEILQSDSAPELAADLESLFYHDGTIRVGGREYNGLVRSPCYERGVGERRLSCFSCHSMHQSQPSDQLAEGKSGNDACLSCHEDKRANVSAHTHHAASSPGSLCYNCHMPHTTYALLGAIRSHRVDSPRFDERARDRPSACSLCHLERSEAWAAEASARWFGSKPRLTLSGRRLERAELPAGAVFALTGDAAVRAITAAALGRSESAAPAPALRRQLLETLASDDYAAVRAIAARALGNHAAASPGAAASPDDRPLTSELVQRLLSERDQRPVTIAE